MKHRGFNIEPIYPGQYFWSYPDFDGGDIDHETPTQDPHGTGTVDQCKESIDEYLDEQKADLMAKGKGQSVAQSVQDTFKQIFE